MNRSSVRPSRTTTFSTPLKNAASVPGRTRTRTSAVRAMGVSRGSITISLAPRSRAPQKYWVATGKVSPTLAPATMTTWVSNRSAHGFAARSMPNAFLFAAAADTMQRRPL
jgi:hypothetical protein